MNKKILLNLEAGKLDVHLHENGIVLVRLQNGKLTDQTYQLADGRLQSLDPTTIQLSEAFAPRDEHGIVNQNNIPLEEFLSTQ